MIPWTLSETLDQLYSPDLALSQHQSEAVVCTDDHKAASVAEPLSSTRASLLEQIEARVSTLGQEQEWEIRRMVGSRRAGKRYEYKVR